MSGPLDAGIARALAHGPGEIAFLDVREHGQYGEGHPFLAVPCPFSRLEATAPSLVPRRAVPVLLVDEGDGIAERAANALGRMGYEDVSWIAGGAPAWSRAGFTLYKGVNLPSKTLGELLEETWHVPRIDVDTLAAWQSEGRPHRLFDGRPSSEYRKTTIPGARSMPNGELPHRLPALLSDPALPIVVHCAGRTRSIVGAAGLALAGVPNPVWALENGTQGWALSGRTLEADALPAPLPVLDDDAQAASRARARAVLARYDIPLVEPGDVARLSSDGDRTLYVLDVRSADEFAAGTLPGAVHAPAVQLAQATDGWIGVRRARVVLLDGTGLRAAITAVFLKAMRYEVFVLPNIDEAKGMRPPEPVRSAAKPAQTTLEPIAASDALAAARAGGGWILDLRGSMAYRGGHLEDALWTIRPRLARLDLDHRRLLALVGEPEVVAPAAADLAERGAADLRHVAGGRADWLAAGLPVVATPERPSDAEAIDHLFFVHDRHEGNLEAARRYLEWETGLVATLDTAERAEFRIGPSPFPQA